MSIPDTLAHQIELYRASGRVILPDRESFAEQSWFSIMAGLGLEPRTHDPFVALVDEGMLRTHFARLRQAIAGAVAGIPSHNDFVERYAEAAWSTTLGRAGTLPLPVRSARRPPVGRHGTDVRSERRTGCPGHEPSMRHGRYRVPGSPSPGHGDEMKASLSRARAWPYASSAESDAQRTGVAGGQAFGQVDLQRLGVLPECQGSSPQQFNPAHRSRVVGVAAA